MSRRPPSGDATWKGIAIIVVSVLIGLAVLASFDNPKTTAVSASGPDQKKATTTTTKTGGSAASTTSSSIPLKQNKDVKVLLANATETSGATKKVQDALKPACYTIVGAVDALAKVKQEKRETTTVYSTTGFEREAALIATKLGLPASANAALPAESPVSTKGTPSFSVLVLVAKDLVDKPPEPLPGSDCATSESTTSTKAGSGSRSTTTKKTTGTTSGSRITTTTRGITTTTRPSTTVTT